MNSLYHVFKKSTSIGAENGCATPRKHRVDKSKAGAGSGGREAYAPRSGLCAGLRDWRPQASRGEIKKES